MGFRRIRQIIMCDKHGEYKGLNKSGFSLLGILIACVIISAVFLLNINKYDQRGVNNDKDNSMDHPIVNPSKQMSVLGNTKNKLDAIEDRNKRRGEEVLDLFDESKY